MTQSDDGQGHSGRPPSPAGPSTVESRALDYITRETDPEKLLEQARNAAGKSSVVEQAALRRLATASARHESGSVEQACWEMVHAVEALRRLKGRKVWKMHRMRPKIERDGERAALEYCASRRTDGFDEILAYGLPELTAEAIVLRFPGVFPASALESARARLEDSGIEVGPDGRLI